MPAHRWAALRRYILNRDGRRCGRHGRLEVHHVDGDPSNNDPGGNLLTLCKGCHIRLHKPPVSPAVAAWRALVDETGRAAVQ